MKNPIKILICTLSIIILGSVLNAEEKKNITFSCGSHFGLGVQRHRFFEASFPIEQLNCDHKSPHWPIGPKGKPKPIGVYGRKGDKIKGMCHKTGKMQMGGWTAKTVEEAQQAMGITHISSWRNLCQAVPPAYTEHISKCFFKHMNNKSSQTKHVVQGTLERWI